jgi:hypothetical protein
MCSGQITEAGAMAIPQLRSTGRIKNIMRCRGAPTPAPRRPLAEAPSPRAARGVRRRIGARPRPEVFRAEFDRCAQDHEIVRRISYPRDKCGVSNAKTHAAKILLDERISATVRLLQRKT